MAYHREVSRKLIHYYVLYLYLYLNGGCRKRPLILQNVNCKYLKIMYWETYFFKQKFIILYTHNKECLYLYSPARIMKSRKLQGTGHLGRKSIQGKRKQFWWQQLLEKVQMQVKKRRFNCDITLNWNLRIH